MATSTVTGTVLNPSSAASTPSPKVVFELKGTGGNQPRVISEADIAPVRYEFTCNSSGVFSGTVYRNDTIDCGGSTDSNFYVVTEYYNGVAGPSIPYRITTASWNKTSATPISTSPTITAPTGDNTYLRLDAGNLPGTNNLKWPKFQDIRMVDGFSGASVGAQIDAAAADLAGARGLLLIPSTFGSGSSLVGIPDTVTVLDLRGVVGPNYEGTEGTQFSKGITLRTRWTTAPNSVANYQPLLLYCEPFSGGYNTSPSPKTNYAILTGMMTARTIGQHLGFHTTMASYTAGDTQAITGVVYGYGSRLTSGDEGNVGGRFAVRQGSEVVTGTVDSVSGNVITLKSSPTPTTRLIGEDRPLINTRAATIYSTGTISGISTRTVTGTGSPAWDVQFGVGAKTNLFFSLDSETRSGIKWVVPIASIDGPDTLTLEHVSAGANVSWGGLTSTGAYQIFKGSNVETFSANVGDTSPVLPTVTVVDGTQFAALDTVEQPLGYAYSQTALKIDYIRRIRSTNNADGVIGATSIGGLPFSSFISSSGEFTGALIEFGDLGTTYRPTHLIKMSSGNSPTAWIASDDTVDNSTHAMLALAKNVGTGTWSMSYAKNGNTLNFVNQANFLITAVAGATTALFDVRASDAIPWFRVNSTAVQLNNDVDFQIYTGNLGTKVFEADGTSGKITTYNSIATVSGGVPAERATVDLTAQTAAIGTTTLYAVPASGAGQYRVNWNAKITTAATTGAATSTLGAMTIVYTDPDGVVVTITAPASIVAGTIATTSAANTTGTALLGLPLMLNAKLSTNITYAFAYASDTASQMAFNLHIKLEAL